MFKPSLLVYFRVLLCTRSSSSGFSREIEIDHHRDDGRAVNGVWLLLRRDRARTKCWIPYLQPFGLF